MGEEKGKGRASESQNASHEDSQAPADVPHQNSIYARVKASTAGLASSAFSAPSMGEIDNGAAALLGDSGKSSHTGTSSSSSYAESSRPTDRTTGSKEAKFASFRNGLEQQHMHEMESEFSSFLDGVDSFEPSHDDAFRSDGVNQAAPIQDAFFCNSIPQTVSEHQDQRDTSLTVKEQERLDGDDVLALLSSPSIMDENPEEDAEVDSLGLTPEQISKIRSITSSLFPPLAQHVGPPAGHPLNLYPDLDTPQARAVSQLQLGTDTEEARRIFIQQWEGVLTGYVDEVWGDLLPLVKEARQEVETIKSEDTPYMPPKALRRLGLILSHLQK